MSDKIKILVAEDNEVNQKVIRAILDRRGTEYRLVTDGRQAVDAYATERFNLILMDCQMPRLDGLSAATEIRQEEVKSNSKRCPIIALTANAMRDDKGRCLQAGMDDFLAKPFRSVDLIQKIERWTTEYSKDHSIKEEK